MKIWTGNYWLLTKNNDEDDDDCDDDDALVHESTPWLSLRQLAIESAGPFVNNPCWDSPRSDRCLLIFLNMMMVVVMMMVVMMVVVMIVAVMMVVVMMAKIRVMVTTITPAPWPLPCIILDEEYTYDYKDDGGDDDNYYEGRFWRVLACRLWNLYENDDNMMLTMKTMPKGWDTEWHARKSCPTWTSTMGHCSDLGRCVLCVCKNLAWQAKDRSSQHHNQITISFKSYSPFNFRYINWKILNCLSAQDGPTTYFMELLVLFRRCIELFFWHDDWIPKNCAVDS